MWWFRVDLSDYICIHMCVHVILCIRMRTLVDSGMFMYPTVCTRMQSSQDRIIELVDGRVGGEGNGRYRALLFILRVEPLDKQVLPASPDSD